ncbi:MAG: tetratricopeptide repeat protein [Victivallaceae bacterium]
MSKRWIIILMALFLTVQTALVFAEDDEFSPWEAWRQGFSNYEKGEQSKNRGNNEEALKCFQRAREYYVTVQNNRPEWNQKIIGSRIKMCDQEISDLKKELYSKRADSSASEERAAPRAAARPPSDSSSSSAIPSTVSSSSFGRDVDSDTSEVKAELEKYKKKLFAVLVEVDELRRQAERGQSASREVENMIKEKGVLQQQLSLLQQKYDALNDKITQPDTEKNELKNRMLEEKMKMEILSQKLKMQDDNYEKLRREMADLYKDKTEAKFTQQQSEQKIRELNDQILRYEKDSADRGSQIRGLNAQIEQLTQNNNANLASLKEKQEEIRKLNKWTEELREKDGSQNKMAGEVMNENKAIREKSDALKEQYEKLAVENQELKNKQLEEHIAFTRMKDTVKLINDQKNSIVDEYNNLTKKYNQGILTEGANTKEIQNLREQNSKQDRELKLFVDKYERIQKRLEERSANEYQNILAVNKTNSELTEKLSIKSEELTSLNLKYGQLNKANQDNANALADMKAKMYALNAENSSLKEETRNLASIKSEVQTLQQDNQLLRKEKAEISSQRDKYQTALDSTTKEIASLKKDLETLQGASGKEAALKKDLETLQAASDKEITALKKELEALQGASGKEIAALKKDLETLQGASGELQETRKQVQTLRAELAGLKNVDKMNAQMREEVKAMTAVKDENQQLNEQLAKSRNVIAELKDKSLKLAETGDKIQQAANVLEAEKKNLGLLLAEKDKMLAAFKEESKKTLANQQQIQDSLKEASKNDKDKIVSLDEINKRLADALEKSRNDNRIMEQSVNSLKSDNAALTDIKKRFEQGNLAINQIQEKVDKLVAENTSLQSEIKTMTGIKNENAELRLKVKEMADVKENYKTLNANYQEALEQIKRISNNSSDEMNKKLGAMLDKSKNEKRELSEKVVALQSEVSAIPNLQKQIVEQEQSLKEYKEKYQAATESRDKINMELSKLDDLKKANAALSAKNSEMTVIQDDYKKLQSSYQQALQSINAYQQSDKNKLASLDELNKKLTVMLDKSKSENQKLSQDIDVLKQNNNAIPALKEEINVLKNSLSGEAGAKKSLTAQLAKTDALKDQLSSMDSAVTVMKRQLAERDSVVSDLKKQLSSKSADSDLTEKYSAAENKINTLAANLKESREKIKSLEAQLSEKKSTVVDSALSAKYAAAENKINILSVNLRESMEKIKSLELQLTEKKAAAPEIKLAAPAVPAAKIQELLTNGIVAEKKQDLEVALWHFQMVLESEPNNLIAHRHLGRLYLQIEDYDKAVEHLGRAVKADSKNSDSAADYGFALLGSKRYDQSADTFKNLIKTQSDNPKARFGLGCALQSKGDVKNAEKEFRAALRIKPDSVEIMQKLALLLAGDKDKTSEASELYRKSRKLGGSPEPELEKLLSGKLASANNEAVSFLQQSAADAEKSKDWGSAAWYYSQLADLSPDNAEVQNKVGMLHLLQNAPDKALKAVKANDNDISALLTSAEAWIFKGNSAMALETFTKAQAALGKNPGYTRPELLKSLDSIVELKIKNLPDDASKKVEKVYDLFKQFSKK